MAVKALSVWFYQLVPRERWLVLGAGAFAALVLLFSLVFQPLFAARERAAVLVEQRQSLLRDIEAVAGPFGAETRPEQERGASQESLVVQIDRSAREQGLGSYLKRNQPEGANGVRLRLENAPFDDLSKWLAEIEIRHQLYAVSASINDTDEAGRVNSNLVLETHGP